MQFKPHKRAQQIFLFYYITIKNFIARKAIISTLSTKKQKQNKDKNLIQKKY